MPPPTPNPNPKLIPTLYTGTFISTPTPHTFEILPRHAVAVDEHGVITHRGALPPRRNVDEGGGDGDWREEEEVRRWVRREWGIEIEIGVVEGGGGDGEGGKAGEKADESGDGGKWEWVRGGGGGGERGEGRGWWFPGFVGE